MKREERFCPICPIKSTKKGHFLTNCSLYSPFRKVLFSKIKQDYPKSQGNLKTIIIDLFGSNDVLRLATFLEDSLFERYITVTFNQAQGPEYDLTLISGIA